MSYTTTIRKRTYVNEKITIALIKHLILTLLMTRVISKPIFGIQFGVNTKDKVNDMAVDLSGNS